ncbi:class I SAM-dependent methyltransferase [Candidatus Curtissbacteria bacterium]|nr:class I SAM-dependent methyltransferase [Candidatus Curtissbacteria bacterium]
MQVIDDLKQLYINRFTKNDREERKIVWQVLCQNFFQKYIDPQSSILDLGAGYCEFINSIKAKRKIAIDLNTETKKFAQKGVEVFICSSTNLPKSLAGKIDNVFASNFFEHLPTKEHVIKTLAQVKRVLAGNGKIIILHPNIRFLGGQYWDFLDHQLPLSEKSLVEALTLSNFKILKVVPKFLPYTTKTKLPKRPWLVKLYLILKPAHFIFGKQSLIIAQKP